MRAVLPLRTALIISLFTLGLAGPASAIPTVRVEFGGASTITVTSSSAVVTASVFIDLTGEPGTNQYGIDIDFDSAGQNLLDFVSGTELLPPGLLFNITPECCDNVTESDPGVPGSVFDLAFESAGCCNANAGLEFQIGTLQFHVTGEFGSTDVTPRLGSFGILSNNVPFPTVSLVGGTINHPVPEPGTAALLALGLGTLTLTGRRRRS